MSTPVPNNDAVRTNEAGREQAATVETELEREMRLAEEADVLDQELRGRILDELEATQARIQEEAEAAKRGMKSPRKEKGKGKEESLPELTPEVFNREMRGFGTSSQQEEWQEMDHEVRGRLYSCRFILTIFCAAVRRLLETLARLSCQHGP